MFERKIALRIYLIYIFILNTVFVLSQNTNIELKANWQFRQTGTGKFYNASVPGSVHTDLYANKLIKDPFFGDNEKDLQWIENEDWEYIGKFTCDNNTLRNKHIELNFEGLDTYAKVFLNGKQILECNNMFRSWNVDVKPYLKIGENTLRIVFESAVKKGKAEAAKLSYTLPGNEKVFTRKAQYQYGWDWGPRFVTCGIYKPIQLVCWNDFKFESINHIIKDLDGSKANIKFIIEIESDIDSIYDISITSAHNVKRPQDLHFSQTRKIHLHKGFNIDTLKYTINRPQLWFPNGITSHSACYTFNFDILNKKQKTSIIKNLTIGLRTIELIQDKDSIGRSFYFKINGKPIFMKGANYIPQDNFVSRTTKKNNSTIVNMAKDANMNMLRVWGGGLYPNDDFYERCNRNGILVWQDFMFACAMYLGDSAFVENVKQEITQQVKRLRNHPCLALWCGNNEIDEGWQNWGWQKQYKYSKKDSAKIWGDYQNLFHQIIPKIVKENNSTASYWPSSPSIGWGHKESLIEGDSHYWGVWWGNEPFETYTKKIGRFMSEYGFQGMPDMNTLQAVCDTLSLNSMSVKAHQKHPKGYETIQTYMERDYKVPANFSHYNYVSQLLQRDGMKMAIEAHRRAMPYCMGTLYWQLNDCWPVTSWSSIDYNYKPKALFYETKKLYNDITISIIEEKNDYHVFVVSDKLHDTKAKLNIYLKDLSGKILYQKTDSVLIKSNGSSIYFTITASEFKNLNKQEMYLSATLKDYTDRKINETIFCFVKPKELLLKSPEIKIDYSIETNCLLISSKTFVKDLYLYSNNASVTFSDNYIDIEPNQIIEIKTNIGMELYKQIQYISLYDINN